MMIKRNKLGFASLAFIIYIFSANCANAQNFGGFSRGPVITPYNGYNNSVGFGATSPNYGPLTFYYPIENVIVAQFPGQFIVNNPYRTNIGRSPISRKNSNRNRR